MTTRSATRCSAAWSARTAPSRQLRASLARPVHAYLFVGPPGSSKEAAALGFAAGLVCPNGGCGVCDSCRRALRGVHPDVTSVQRTGAAISVEEIRAVTARALRRPVEGVRQVLVIDDVHLAVRSAPALLKTLEEPPRHDRVRPHRRRRRRRGSRRSRAAARPSRSARSARPRSRTGSWDAASSPSTRGSSPPARRATSSALRCSPTTRTTSSRLARWREVPAQLDGAGSTAALLADELLCEPRRRARAAADGTTQPSSRPSRRRRSSAGSVGLPGRKRDHRPPPARRATVADRRAPRGPRGPPARLPRPAPCGPRAARRAARQPPAGRRGARATRRRASGSRRPRRRSRRNVQRPRCSWPPSSPSWVR